MDIYKYMYWCTSRLALQMNISFQSKSGCDHGHRSVAYNLQQRDSIHHKAYTLHYAEYIYYIHRMYSVNFISTDSNTSNHRRIVIAR